MGSPLLHFYTLTVPIHHRGKQAHGDQNFLYDAPITRRLICVHADEVIARLPKIPEKSDDLDLDGKETDGKERDRERERESVHLYTGIVMSNENALVGVDDAFNSLQGPNALLVSDANDVLPRVRRCINAAAARFVRPLFYITARCYMLYGALREFLFSLSLSLAHFLPRCVGREVNPFIYIYLRRVELYTGSLFKVDQ